MPRLLTDDGGMGRCATIPWAVFPNRQPEHDRDGLQLNEVVRGTLRFALRLEYCELRCDGILGTADEAQGLIAYPADLNVEQGTRTLISALGHAAAVAAPAQEATDMPVAGVMIGASHSGPSHGRPGPQDLPAVQTMRRGLVVGRLITCQVEDE